MNLTKLTFGIKIQKKHIIAQIVFFALCCLPFGSSAAENYSNEEIIVEAASSYLTTFYSLQSIKKSKCGYAISFNSNQINNLTKMAEDDVKNTIPKSSKDDLRKFTPKMKQAAKESVAELQESYDKSNLDNNTKCGLLAGTVTGMISVELRYWKSAQNKYLNR